MQNNAPSPPLATFVSVEHSAMPSGQSFPWEVAWFSGRHPVLQTQICLILQHFFQIYEFPVRKKQKCRHNKVHCTVSNEVMGSAGYEDVRKCVVFISIRHHIGLHQSRKAHSPKFSFLKFSFCRNRYASRICGPSKSISAADACSSPTATSMACQTFALSKDKQGRWQSKASKGTTSLHNISQYGCFQKLGYPKMDGL